MYNVQRIYLVDLDKINHPRLSNFSTIILKRSIVGGGYLSIDGNETLGHVPP